MYESNIVAIDHLFNQVIKLWTVYLQHKVYRLS